MRYAAGGNSDDTNLLNTTVLIAESTYGGSRCLDRDEWYNESKARVREVDTRILSMVMQRRMRDQSRGFTTAEYGNAMKRLKDKYIFTRRWLTSRTKEQPLSEDKNFLLS